MNSRKEIQRLQRHQRSSLVVEERNSHLLERINGGDRRFIKRLSCNLFVPAVCGSHENTDTSMKRMNVGCTGVEQPQTTMYVVNSRQIEVLMTSRREGDEAGDQRKRESALRVSRLEHLENPLISWARRMLGWRAARTVLRAYLS